MKNLAAQRRAGESVPRFETRRVGMRRKVAGILALILVSGIFLYLVLRIIFETQLVLH